MRHRASGLSVGLWLILAGLVLGLFSGASCSEITLQKAIAAPGGQRPALPTGNGNHRGLVVAYGLPFETDGPVVVVARANEIWYVDGLTLEVLQKLAYEEKESAIISQNGAYIAVQTQTYERKTRKTRHWVRVEDCHGRRMWQMLSWDTVEPTPVGGLVVDLAPHFSENPDVYSYYAQADVEPHLQPHPLRVYDSNGDLLLEGVDPEECRFSPHYSSISPDGSYLAYLFIWLPPESRESNRDRELGRVCLALYDIEKGVELWRHYFEGTMPGQVAVGPEAARIVCFVSRGPRGSAPEGYTMYVFDAEGSQLTERDLIGSEGIVGPQDPTLSADGVLCAVKTLEPGVHVIRMEDGSQVWHWKHMGELHVGSIAIANDSSVVMYGAVATREKMVWDRIAFSFDARGNLTAQTDPGLLLRRSSRSIPTSVEVSKDGDLMWIDDGDSLRVFGVR